METVSATDWQVNHLSCQKTKSKEKTQKQQQQQRKHIHLKEISWKNFHEKITLGKKWKLCCTNIKCLQ